ncbi:DUF1002 domain-containing protein [Intestinibacter sp.]|uniref:DUF1002 domain-containing protein n=1 Tax=Intestinibacter sp. TaxID=1965304 RepID=UPI002A90EB22|nr:DUF1002 domain-containing protein [Intestinibacter sp.]MDY5212416.1 DUF1002 domain-containing protein [Intestinibacter sp.]
MKIKNKIVSVLMATCLTFSSFGMSKSFADSSKVVTIGVNNTAEQRQTILNYFGVKENEVQIITVNNKEERAYLGKVATEEQLGTKTYSCAYVEPTKEGSGINVKTANITWVTSSMVATTLSTAGLTGANCVIAAVFPVSGTGALTGVMKAFENATGETLDEDKKELASEELITTGDLGDQIGQDKATGIINDVKADIIKNNTSDKTQIANTINNITNNYNVTLTDAQVDKIIALMEKIAAQHYDYNEMKATLNNVSDVVQDNLKEAGEDVGSSSGILSAIGSFFSSIGDWFSNLFSGSKDLGILGETNDSMLGSQSIIDATDKAAENLPSREEAEGFFTKIINWFRNLFSSDDSSNGSDNSNSNDGSTMINPDNSGNNTDNNTNSDSNVNTDDNSNINDNQNSDNGSSDNNTLVPEVETDTEHFDSN